MKVKMLEQLKGTRNGQRWPEVGTIVDLPGGEGADLCAQGVAEPVKAPPEKAVAAEPAKAVPPKPAKKAAAKKSAAKKA